MKKILLLSFILPALGLSSFSALAEIKEIPVQQNTAMNTQAQTKSWLGVRIENIPVSLGSHLLPMLKKDQGIIIKNIVPESPAAQAGLQPYDIIAQFNEHEIFSQQQLTQLIQKTAPDTKVELKLIRQGKLMTQAVMLKPFPGQHTASSGTHFPQGNIHPNFGSRKQFPAPMMNDPFFNSHFDQNFNRKFNQQLHQLRQQMNHLQQQMNQQGQHSSSWSQFESVQIESTGNNQHRAVVKYEDGEGNKKEFIFEGNLQQMRQQILDQKNMDENKKQNLLQALDMNTNYTPFRQNSFMAPGWFNQPMPQQNWFRNNQ